ncbi:uncharacterized protein M437DRAFT_49186 [Aureobasidium melanogenum CBS 110374]|uniref:Uncharacterized protein n=1 Tax=Aureobasidium melanogenum (strain CBS 110374) TaxID=1043003 RepID=A0A074VT27_AURM1|nr:uncharacterized protein M437DRAFT_49186 [Aureobasidium melanogenum CBS 110374]KEQ62399.1 hypothetical protein M437DRAFT_49186 [Aureobasidium melanogenum CBS 110374]
MTAPSISPMESVTSSSTQSSTSRNASSSSSIHPNLARSSSYSHVFPSHQNLINPSDPIRLSEDTKALARRLLQSNPTHPALKDERTLLFSSGLQWLLDTATEAEKASPRSVRQSTRVSPLTEEAVRKLDKHGRHCRVKEVRDTRSMNSSEVDRARINAWVSETDAAP